MLTVEEYIIKHNENITINEWKVLFFQVLYVLHKITEKIPGFRHNMLNLNSVRMYIFDEKEKEINTEYEIGEYIYNIPNVNFEIRITDFDMSTNLSHNIPKNKSVKLKNENPYYDIHYFFNLVYNLLRKQKINKNSEEVIEFINSIISQKYLIKIPDMQTPFQGLDEVLYDTSSGQMITPEGILEKNKFFVNFINKKMDFTNSPIENKNINVELLNKKENGVKYLSITEDASDKPRMLGRYKSKNKYSKEYNKKMIKKSRKIFMPNSESSVFEKTNSGTYRKNKKNSFSATSEYGDDDDNDNDDNESSDMEINTRLSRIRNTENTDADNASDSRMNNFLKKLKNISKNMEKIKEK
jgi:hypothetical protein